LSSGRIIGAFVFDAFWESPLRAGPALRSLRDCGVNAIMTESDAYDRSAIDLTHQEGLRFYAGVACFSDHASDFRLLEERPELWPILENGEPRTQMEWYIGMSPTDRRRQEEALATIRSIATNYPIDGLFLDFVRWPLHWEIELRPGRSRPLDSSFDANTLKQFEEATGLLPQTGVETPAGRAAWIRENRLAQWIDFKCSVVTSFVREARSALKGVRPEAELGVYLVPDVDGLTEPLTGQRLGDLAPLVEWAAPMLYHNILLRAPSWINVALSHVVSTAGSKTLPVVQADSNRDPGLIADWGPEMTDADFRAVLSEIAAKPEVAGLIVFPGAALSGGRAEALAAMSEAWG
jgi:hypothetical protein